MKINKKNMRLAGIFLILLGILLGVNNIYESLNAQKKSQIILNGLEDLGGVKKEVPDIEMELNYPIKTINGIDIIGYIEIPKLQKKLPVAATWDYEIMKSCPNRYKGKKYLEPLIILGHNYRSHFKDISRLDRGDEIIFTDVLGRSLYYTVDIMEIIDGNDITSMVSTDYDLTLFTCTFDRVNRVTIRAMRKWNFFFLKINILNKRDALSVFFNVLDTQKRTLLAGRVR